MAAPATPKAGEAAAAAGAAKRGAGATAASEAAAKVEDEASATTEKVSADETKPEGSATPAAEESPEQPRTTEENDAAKATVLDMMRPAATSADAARSPMAKLLLAAAQKEQAPPADITALPRSNSASSVDLTQTNTVSAPAPAAAATVVVAAEDSAGPVKHPSTAAEAVIAADEDKLQAGSPAHSFVMGVLDGMVDNAVRAASPEANATAAEAVVAADEPTSVAAADAVAEDKTKAEEAAAEKTASDGAEESSVVMTPSEVLSDFVAVSVSRTNRDAAPESGDLTAGVSLAAAPAAGTCSSVYPRSLAAARPRLTAYFAAKCPEQLDTVDDVLHSVDQDNYELLFPALIDRYGPEPPVSGDF